MVGDQFDHIFSSVSVEILVPPVSDTVLLGENGTFTCKANGSNVSVLFCVEGDPSNYKPVKAQGFITYDPVSNGTIVERTMVAVGKMSNDNTEIKCVAYASMNDDCSDSDPSSEVYFRVQGIIANFMS